MPRAASTVVEALGRYPRRCREDQLTELFALVLEAVPELSSWFIRQALGSKSGSDFDTAGTQAAVFTQASAPGSGRPDMIVDYRDPDGRPRRILSEHKIDADFTDIQRTGYGRWQSRDALVLVAPVADNMPAQFDQHIAWVSVAREVERIVREDSELAGADWRRRCLLTELLVMLEDHNMGVDVATPVELSDVLVYQSSSRAIGRMASFISTIREQEPLRPLEPSEIYSEGMTSWWFTLDALEVRWPVPDDDPSKPWTQVALQESDDWVPAPDRLGQPLLYCGFYFEAPQRVAPASVNKRIDALADAGIKVGLHPDGKQAKCAATLYLSELLVVGPSLRDQAERAATWAAREIRSIVEIIHNADPL